MNRCAVVHCKSTENLIPNSDKTSYICEKCLTPNEKTTTWEFRL